MFMYLLGFLSSLPTLFPCCHTLWNSDYYITVYDPMDTWQVTFTLQFAKLIFRYKYVDMGVNSLSLLMMVFSYAIIIYKVRESGKAMAKYQLTIRTRVGSKKVCASSFLFLIFILTLTNEMEDNHKVDIFRKWIKNA